MASLSFADFRNISRHLHHHLGTTALGPAIVLLAMLAFLWGALVPQAACGQDLDNVRNAVRADDDDEDKEDDDGGRDLENIRNAVRADDDDDGWFSSRRRKEKHHHHHHHHYHYCDDDDCDSGFEEFCGAAFLAAITSPWWGPVVYLNDTYDRESFLPHRPYEYGDGYFRLGPLDESLRGGPRDWAGRISAEYGDNFDNLYMVSGHLTLETSSRLGLDVDWRSLDENVFGRFRDQLWVGDANIIFRFAQCETAAMYTGLGFAWMDDQHGTEFGWNFTYGGDWYPRRPFIFSAVFDGGELGNANLYRFRATAGIVIHGIESYTGYDHLTIGHTHIDSWVAGVRIWF